MPVSRRSAALTLCLITDRRRLLAAVGEPLAAWRGILLSQIEGAVRGGVDVIQIREPDVPGSHLRSFVADCLAVVRGTPTKVLLNDRVDVALAAGAHGVHLREASLPINGARRLLGADCIIGRSIHTAEAAVAARTADYLIVGSVFETQSKPGLPARLGLKGLSEVVDAAHGCPVWAIGGVTAERIPRVVECGASGVAGIGAFIAAVNRQELASTVQKLTTELRFSFDSSIGLS